MILTWQLVPSLKAFRIDSMLSNSVLGPVMYEHMYVWVYVCMSLCMYEHMYLWAYVCMIICMYEHICLDTYKNIQCTLPCKNLQLRPMDSSLLKLFILRCSNFVWIYKYLCVYGRVKTRIHIYENVINLNIYIYIYIYTHIYIRVCVCVCV